MALDIVIRKPAFKGAAIQAESDLWPGPLDLFVFDAVLEEVHEHEASVTRYPVEVGADRADHKQEKVRKFRVTGVYTNTPNEVLEQTPSRDFEGWRILDGLVGTAETVNVVTRMQTYKEMSVVKVSVNRNPKTGQSINATVTFEEFLTTEAQVVDVPGRKRSKAVKNDATTTKDQGKKRTTAATKQEEKKVQSLLSDFWSG